MAFRLQRYPAVCDRCAVIEFWIGVLDCQLPVDDVLDGAILYYGFGCDLFAHGSGDGGALDHMLLDGFPVYIDVGSGRADGAGGAGAGRVLCEGPKFK